MAKASTKAGAAAAASRPSKAASVLPENELEQLDGCGPVLAAQLAEFRDTTTLEEVAEWTGAEIDAIDEVIKIKRFRAEAWPDQARQILENRAEQAGIEPVVAPDVPPAAALVDELDAPVEPEVAVEAPVKPKPVAAAPKAPKAKPAASDKRIRRRLNKGLRHSIICGAHMGAAFAQGNLLFNTQGEEIFEDGDYSNCELEPEHAVTTETVDLNAWRRGLKPEYPFDLVRRTIRERHHRDVGDKVEEALEFLNSLK